LFYYNHSAGEIPVARHLTLEEPIVRGLVLQLPRFVQGQPVPVVSILGIAQEIQGFWSLWQISVTSHELYVVGWKYWMPVISDVNRGTVLLFVCVWSLQAAQTTEPSASVHLCLK
jgi:hypothetical protein